MKYRDPETGEFKELYVKAADTLPVGTEVDYDGDEVPAGWEKVEDTPIIESGSNDNGDYVKYSDGTMICSYTQKINTSVNTPWGSLFVSPIVIMQNFPISFIDVPQVNIQANKEKSVWVMSGSNNTINKPMNIYLTTGVQTDTTDFNIDVIAFGKWK